MADHEPETGTHKADFSAIYDQPDPRAYFRTLHPLEYQIPQQALPVLERVHEAAGRDRPLLDICCSYGINGGLLRYDIDLDAMSERYTSPELAELGPDDLAAADREFYDRRHRPDKVTVLGLDAAPEAIAYARAAGLVDDGWAENLEENRPSPELSSALSTIGTITCTGGVGYIGATTFDRLLAEMPDPQQVWLAVFVLREFDYADIAKVLDSYGLVTEQIPDTTFRQRRFADADEQQAALHDVVDRGLDPAGKEADGWFHADCFITRPAAAADRPLTDLLAGLALA